MSQKVKQTNHTKQDEGSQTTSPDMGFKLGLLIITGHFRVIKRLLDIIIKN